MDDFGGLDLALCIIFWCNCKCNFWHGCLVLRPGLSQRLEKKIVVNRGGFGFGSVVCGLFGVVVWYGNITYSNVSK